MTNNAWQSDSRSGRVTPKTGDAIVLDHGSVTWNGDIKSGNVGGSPIPFYNGN